MNDGIFSSYDSFFCGSTLSSDFTASMHMIEQHDFAQTTHYFNEQPLQQNQLQHIHQPISFSTVIPQASQQTTNTAHTFLNNINALPTTVNAQTTSTTATTNATTTSTTPFGNIPFVQIHTTDVQPQRIHNSKVFRRTTANNHEEIKSEPIKSENADATKERINGTPTPPVRSASGNGNSERIASPAEGANSESRNDACSISMTNDVEVADQTNSTNSDRTIAYPSVYKCDQCPFISLSESGVATHITATHADNIFCHEEWRFHSRIACPGCENIFYALTSLETHLREDHLMVLQDSTQLISIVKRILTSSQKQCDAEDINDTTSSTANKTENIDSQRKSRIYLKNVEYLREPRREPIEQLKNQIAVSYNFEITNNSMGTSENNVVEGDAFLGALEDQHIRSHNNNINSTPTINNKISPNSQKQKISIKSVDVLREPALLRRDYEIQNFNNLMNVCSDLDLPPINSSEQFVYVTPNETANSNLLCSNDVNMSNNLSNFEKPRRPKIFIKNVDILKKPMTFSSNINGANLQDSNQFNFMSQTLPQSVNNFLNSDDILTAPAQVYDTQQLPMSTISEQYLFDNGNTIGNNIPNGNYMSGVGDEDEDFSFVNTQNSSNNNFILDSARFSSILDCALDSSHTETPTPIITEPTPPPPPIALSLNLTDSIEHTLLETTTSVSNSTTCASLCPTSVSMAPLKSKQKIFIKNVDILKEPQFQEHRGTLHLRTVDELNLMNKNEVENLIAPNLDNTQMHAGGGILNAMDLNEAYNNSMENSGKLADPLTESLYANNSNNFKLQDFDSQVVNNWSDDYSLGDDIDCIITAIIAPMDANVSATTAQPMQKIIHDLDTPQMSMISIRDIEELTGGQQQIIDNSTFESQEMLVNNEMQMPHALETDNLDDQVNVENTDRNETHAHDYSHSNYNLPCDNHSINEHNFYQSSQTPTNIENIPKQEQTSLITTTVPAKSSLEPQTNILNSPTPPVATAVNYNEIPPLAPVTTSILAAAELPPQSLNVSNNTALISPSNTTTTSLPVPPLVPVPPLIKLNISVPKSSSLATTTASSTAICTLPETTSSLLPTHRGRIYVANNLMQNNALNKPSCPSKSQPAIAVAVTGGTSVRGRPFGSNRTGITKMRKLYGNAAEIEVGIKCTVTGCAFRFKKFETLEYHKRCHNSNILSSPPSMFCPECKSTAFTNWNTLHTHLWRSHQIDMELYKCELCPFKTPCYSRLLNTHSKIHSEERNFKCDECSKAFKNTKQLKNHRRWHRIHNISQSESSAVKLHRCKDCDAVFQLQKTLREHRCKNSASQVQCELCGRVVTSKSSLKLHMLTHKVTKRYQCNVCDYAGNDHNSFRRHKMIHATDKYYVCPHCDYKSIQSVAYQKHIQQKHPHFADSLVHKCNLCSFSTINRTLFTVHQAKHSSSSSTVITAVTTDESIEHNNYFQTDVEDNEENALIIENSTKLINNAVTPTQDSISKIKIKVKSNLMLTDPTKFSDNVNDNVMQSFENPIT